MQRTTGQHPYLAYNNCLSTGAMYDFSFIGTTLLMYHNQYSSQSLRCDPPSLSHRQMVPNHWMIKLKLRYLILIPSWVVHIATSTAAAVTPLILTQGCH